MPVYVCLLNRTPAGYTDVLVYKRGWRWCWLDVVQWDRAELSLLANLMLSMVMHKHVVQLVPRGLLVVLCACTEFMLYLQVGICYTNTSPPALPPVSNEFWWDLSWLCC